MAHGKPGEAVDADSAAVLEILRGAVLTPEEVSIKGGIPFSRVRSAIDEMEKEGLVIRVEQDSYTLSPEGEERFREYDTARRDPRGPVSGPILPGDRGRS